MDDEPLWSGARKVERVARHQRQRMVITRLQNMRIFGLPNLGLGDAEPSLVRRTRSASPPECQDRDQPTFDIRKLRQNHAESEPRCKSGLGLIEVKSTEPVASQEPAHGNASSKTGTKSSATGSSRVNSHLIEACSYC